MSRPEQEKQPAVNKWNTILLVVGALWLLSTLFAQFLSLGSDSRFAAGGNVAVIALDGVITGDASSFAEGTIASSDIVGFIEEAETSPDIKAIVLKINSPGGSAVASEEIAKAVHAAHKPTIALIRDIGTSGAYWAASACDYVVASPLSITGSVGVISSYLEFEGLMQKYGVRYRRLVAGNLKDIGSPLKNMTAEEEALFQAALGKSHSYFLDSVAGYRNLDEMQKLAISTGMFYSGAEAQKLGLVDELGGMEAVERRLEEKEGILLPAYVEFRSSAGLIDLLTQASSANSFSLGKGFATGIISKTGAEGSGLRT